MSHLAAGKIRQMLDQPHSLSVEERAHLQGCARCRVASARVIGNAGRVAALLEDRSRPSVDPAEALSALRSRGLNRLSPSSSPRWAAGRLRSRRVRRPAIAGAVLGLIAFTLVGTGVAGNLVKIFEPERMVAVPVDLESLNALPDLTQYGTIAIVQEPVAAEVASLEEAAEKTGLTLLSPAHPVSGGTPIIQTLSSGTASFTFDASRAEVTSGGALPPLPATLDGSSLFLQAGPAVIQTFGGSPGLVKDRAALEKAALEAGRRGSGDLAGLISSLPDLMIVQMKTPVLSSNGPSVEEYRDALLSLPNISPALKDQIRAIGDPSSTLPLPIPIDLATSREVDVNGVTGLLVGDNTGVGSGVVWQSAGMVRAVGGMLSEDEVLDIARSLR